jgi:hypothetical protein
MHLIRLTTAKGEPILLNFDNVTMVQRGEGGLSELYTTDRTSITVTETLEQIEAVVGKARRGVGE